MYSTIARCFGAFRKALNALREYYERDLPVLAAQPSDAWPSPCFPYRRTYTSLDTSAEHRITYQKRYALDDESARKVEGDKLMWFGISDEGVPLCIKFVRRYSKEAHMLCSLKGFAPKLYGFEELPGGWHMVVMEAIDTSRYTRGDWVRRQLTSLSLDSIKGLQEKLKEVVESLHKDGMVHGDLRVTNLLVGNHLFPNNSAAVIGDGDFKLVDFDWAGKVGRASYPPTVNLEMARPLSVAAGGLISTDHDIEMVGFMFTPLPDLGMFPSCRTDPSHPVLA
jgi:serine/threonine protein kinase